MERHAQVGKASGNGLVHGVFLKTFEEYIDQLIIVNQNNTHTHIPIKEQDYFPYTIWNHTLNSIACVCCLEHCDAQRPSLTIVKYIVDCYNISPPFQHHPNFVPICLLT